MKLQEVACANDRVSEVTGHTVAVRGKMTWYRGPARYRNLLSPENCVLQKGMPSHSKELKKNKEGIARPERF